jgi:predicted RNA-binding protein YlqC (UPF0109 family)
MFMKEFVEHVARSLADHPDDVKVGMSNRGGYILLELHVHEEDMGRVIGKDGRVATALRTLLRLMAAREGQRVQLDIV